MPLNIKHKKRINCFHHQFQQKLPSKHPRAVTRVFKKKLQGTFLDAARARLDQLIPSARPSRTFHHLRGSGLWTPDAAETWRATWLREVFCVTGKLKGTHGSGNPGIMIKPRPTKKKAVLLVAWQTTTKFGNTNLKNNRRFELIDQFLVYCVV